MSIGTIKAFGKFLVLMGKYVFPCILSGDFWKFFDGVYCFILLLRYCFIVLLFA